MQKTILVIEDDIELRETIIDILHEASYTVITAANGEEAVKQLRQKIPDLIISDIIMPKMNGYELFEYVQNSKRYKQVQFVFLTAKSSNQDFRKGMSMGADGYLTKPFKSSELLKMIETRLHKKEYFEEMSRDIREIIALSVPHELRTPLTPILGYSEMMVEYSKSISQKEIEEMGLAIQESALRLRTTIEKFILFSNIQYELGELYENSILKNNSVKEITARVLNVVHEEKKHTKKMVKTEIEIDESPLKIDEFYFDALMKELTENAFKFSFPNTTIKVLGKNKTDLYELSFENIGKGFTKEQIEKINIFNKQYDKTMPGSGLGLPIVKKIVEFFDGNLKIQCLPESATRVTIQLPIADIE
ncbi:MAG: hybrid sensor histidine kinase/response regulator [Ignavibacteriales bacterium]|nr:hybrid sensor histidine kinase/response regulator [Ignavibacteriales bacterium]